MEENMDYNNGSISGTDNNIGTTSNGQINLQSSQDLLKVFDGLPDLRILAETEVKDNSEEPVSEKQIKLKNDYLQKKIPFLLSEILSEEKSFCSECNSELSALEYGFYKDGASLQEATIDGISLHRIREHDGEFPDDVKRVLINIHRGIEEPIGERSSNNTIHRDKVNRINVCPFLVRVFIKRNQLFKEEEFHIRGKEVGEEKHLHCWKDMTLRDITELLKEVEPTLRNWGTRIKYSFVYPDKRGKTVMKEVGTIDSHRGGGRDDLKTLDSLHFQVGDFIAAEIVEKKTN